MYMDVHFSIIFEYFIITVIISLYSLYLSFFLVVTDKFKKVNILSQKSFDEKEVRKFIAINYFVIVNMCDFTFFFNLYDKRLGNIYILVVTFFFIFFFPIHHLISYIFITNYIIKKKNHISKYYF